MPQRRSEQLLRARAMMQLACQAPCQPSNTCQLRGGWRKLQRGRHLQPCPWPAGMCVCTLADSEQSPGRGGRAGWPRARARVRLLKLKRICASNGAVGGSTAGAGASLAGRQYVARHPPACAAANGATRRLAEEPKRAVAAGPGAGRAAAGSRVVLQGRARIVVLGCWSWDAGMRRERLRAFRHAETAGPNGVAGGSKRARP